MLSYISLFALNLILKPPKVLSLLPENTLSPENVSLLCKPSNPYLLHSLISIMGFSHLVNIAAAVKVFKAKYNISRDIFIEYFSKGNIEDRRVSRVVFIPLMAILKGRVRFLLNPLLLGTLKFYGFSPNQYLPNFYKMVGCVSQLNRLYNLRLTHHDINFLYSCCGSLKNGNYLKVQDTRIRLISCLLGFNKNSQGEFIKVSRNWLADKLTCPTSP